MPSTARPKWHNLGALHDEERAPQESLKTTRATAYSSAFRVASVLLYLAFYVGVGFERNKKKTKVLDSRSEKYGPGTLRFIRVP